MFKWVPAFKCLAVVVCAGYVSHADTTVLPFPGNSPVERSVSSNSIDSFRIEMEKGAYVRLDVLNTTGDLRVRFRGPDGRAIREEVFVPPDVAAAEPLGIEADASGTYLVEISPVETSSVRYRIRLVHHLNPVAHTSWVHEHVLLQPRVSRWIREHSRPVQSVQNRSEVR